ncbi:SDR family NAD(P)-dependent oxidoreductase [Chitinimonas koreensis]|uniref:SDR family NAD(P)-dependent oxidoreductase n=1 Tax=Chitinimonas koreensis TaxID=356302 RepID=UPI000423AFA8|nr:SDR family oxidoreductase [Chitinimonas koreensis]QNM95567.1 SDR family oxidoreductase [Chitinimonas koreensis]
MTAPADPSLAGRLALVVGGSSGIGLASARRLGQAGARLVIAGRDAARGEAARAELAAAGFTAEFEPVDVAEADSVAGLFERLTRRHGPLSIAVNSAAASFRPARIDAFDLDEADAVLDCDLRGIFLLLRGETAAMAGGGAIVNIASTNGLAGTPQAAIYAAAKAGVINLTRSAALEWIVAGIRINAVCPGAVITPRRANRLAGLDEAGRAAAMAATAAHIPIGRLAEAEEIAEAVCWLCSDASRYVVGHSLVVDGGLSA